jgi:hypothetical protein
MGYRAKAASSFLLALLFCSLALNAQDDPYPLWLVALMTCGATALTAHGIRQLRLYRYYEGPRTRLVVEARSGRASRR